MSKPDHNQKMKGEPKGNCTLERSEPKRKFSINCNQILKEEGVKGLVRLLKEYKKEAETALGRCPEMNEDICENEENDQVPRKREKSLAESIVGVECLILIHIFFGLLYIVWINSIQQTP